MMQVNPEAGVTLPTFTTKTAPQASEGTPTMAQVLAQLQAAETQATETKDMTLDEYGQYIRDAIAALPIHPSQADSSISVHISPEGLEAMQNDPEYEKWVLDSLAYDFAFNDPWSPLCGGHYIVHYFGATKEEYHGHSWFPGYMGGQGTAMYEERSAGSLWKKTGNTRRTESDLYAKMSARLRLERFLRKLALQRSDQQSAILEQASKHRQMVEAMNRSGRKPIVEEAPVQFTGVPASYLLSMLGGGFF